MVQQYTSAMRLPLQGVRVLDLTSVLSGPYASQVLADYGAEVIKVEAPEGDSMRRTGAIKEQGMGSAFLGCNRSKRSIVLDLKRPEAQEALLRLVDQADVFMHNIRPQKLARIGITCEALRARNPRLVYASLNGFGEGGTYSGLPAYDDVIQGMSGMVALVGMQTGEMRYLPTAAADKTSAMSVAHAILAALFDRERTGQGLAVEIPMFETMVAFCLVEHFQGMHFEPATSPPGYERVLAPWRRPYRTADGHICMMPYTDAHWQAFFEITAQPQLAADERFCEMQNRMRNISALLEIAGGLVAQHDTAFWLDACGRREIPAARILQLRDLPDDEHLVSTNFFTSVSDPALGTVHFPGVPVRFGGQRPPISMPPRLGEHTLSVLEEAGYGFDEINALLGSGAASQHPDTAS